MHKRESNLVEIFREGFIDEVVFEVNPKGWISFKEVDVF